MKLLKDVIPRSERPSIYTRRFQYPLSEKTPRYWMNNNPWTTHFMHAMSVTFPGGERFFMEAVKAHQAQVQDPELKRDIRQFCGQEAIHGQQHDLLNTWMDQHRLPGSRLTAFVDQRLNKGFNSLLPAKFRLSQTAGLEHITAIMGSALLENEKIMQDMDPQVRPLWVWHALEEIEHKAVAYDVLQTVDSSYWLRALGFAVSSTIFAFGTVAFMTLFLILDRQIFNLRAAWKFFAVLINTGYAKSVMTAYFQYYHPRFHPWKVDDRLLMAKAQDSISPYVKGGRPEGAHLKTAALEDSATATPA